MPALLVTDITPVAVDSAVFDPDTNRFVLLSTISAFGTEAAAVGSNWSISTLNQAEGFVEFDLGESGRPPGPGSKVEVLLPDVGGKGTDDPSDPTNPPPTPNSVGVSWYAGDGVVSLTDRDIAGTSLDTLNTRAAQFGDRYVLDVTAAIRQLREAGQRYLGLKFKALSASTFESFGRGSSFNEAIVLALRATDDTRDVMTKAVKVRTVDGAIVAEFEPKGTLGPVELSALATSLGVNHFNWEQTITGPGNWKFQVWPVTELTEANGKPEGVKPLVDDVIRERGKVLDPLPNGGAENYVIRVDGNQLGDVRYFVVPLVADGSEPYLDEFPQEWAGFGVAGGTEWPTKFVFRDEPIVPSWAYSGANLFMTFKTRLVGVAGDGSLVRFGPDTVFTWKSNAAYNETSRAKTGGIRYRGAIKPDTSGAVPPPTQGGIFDVRLDDGTPVPGFPADPPPVPPGVPPAVPSGAAQPARQFAVGLDGGGSDSARLLNPDQSQRYASTPFPGFAGGVRTASVDFNGDGVAELVLGTGPGGPTRVVVLDGVTQAELFAVDPFEAAFTGGVYVAAGDLDGDGLAELVITPDEGGGPRVRVFRGGDFAQLADFFGIDDSNFRGGARAAVGDINGDRAGDLIVVAGYGGGPRVAMFDGSTVGSTPARLAGDFFAFEQTLRNGVYITAGDLDGDGRAEVIAGGGPGGGPRVTAFSGAEMLAGRQTPMANFFGGDPGNRGGIRLAVKDLDGDLLADLVTGSGPGGGTRVTAYRGSTFSQGGTPPELFAFDAQPGFMGGVFVG